MHDRRLDLSIAPKMLFSKRVILLVGSHRWNVTLGRLGNFHDLKRLQMVLMSLEGPVLNWFNTEMENDLFTGISSRVIWWLVFSNVWRKSRENSGSYSVKLVLFLIM